MPEIVANLHMHTRYSDGSGCHEDIAQAALEAHLEAVIVTDHNVYVEGIEGYYQRGDRRLLLLVGEEIHDQARQPQKSHLLVFGAGQELAHLGWDLEKLIKTVRQSGGLAFAAHPTDPPSPAFAQEDLSWEDWDVQGLHGLEIWNGMSEFKSRLKTKLHGLFYAYFPNFIAGQPFPESLQMWDAQLAAGKQLAAIGGSDAHALQVRLGPLKRVLFPYRYHFRSINTHLLIDEALSGELAHDRRLVLEALKCGKSFIANDMPACGRGFSFSAQDYGRQVRMGEQLSAERGVTLQIRLPAAAECRLVRHAEVLKIWKEQSLCTYITSEPGAYRVEVYRNYLNRRVGWIFSNPIYLRD